MAHEINNPLAGMMQTVAVMANRLDSNLYIPANLKAAEAAGITLEAIEQSMKAQEIPRMMDMIHASGQRIAEIVNNMLSFAHKGNLAVSSHCLEELLDKTLDLAATDYDLKKEYDFKRIKIIKEYAGNLPPIPCQSTKIQQVLLNIFGNGAQAMQTAATKNPEFVICSRYEENRAMV
jgi:signal transduction histidine kinase